MADLPDNAALIQRTKQQLQRYIEAIQEAMASQPDKAAQATGAIQAAMQALDDPRRLQADTAQLQAALQKMEAQALSLLPGAEDPVVQAAGAGGKTGTAADKALEGVSSEQGAARPAAGGTTATKSAVDLELEKQLAKAGANQQVWGLQHSNTKKAIRAAIERAQATGQSLDDVQLIEMSAQGRLRPKPIATVTTDKTPKTPKSAQAAGIKLPVSTAPLLDEIADLKALDKRQVAKTLEHLLGSKPELGMQQMYTQLQQAVRGFSDPKAKAAAQAALAELETAVSGWQAAAAKQGELPDVRAAINKAVGTVHEQAMLDEDFRLKAEEKAAARTKRLGLRDERKGKKEAAAKRAALIESGSTRGLYEAAKDEYKTGKLKGVLAKGSAGRKLAGKLGSGLNMAMMLMLGMDLVKGLFDAPERAVDAFAEGPVQQLQMQGLPSAADMVNEMKMQRLSAGNALAGLDPQQLQDLMAMMTKQTTGLDVAQGERIIGPQNIGPALQQYASQGQTSGLGDMLASI